MPAPPGEAPPAIRARRGISAGTRRAPGPSSCRRASAAGFPYPDGRSEILLLVTGYDFNWQTTYRFAEPRPLPAGTRLRCTATYDNSGGNPLNPDPTRDVSWGRETTDEMMIGFVDYYEEGE